MSLHTPLLLLHLLGFAFGVGASTVLDLRFIWLIFGRRVSDQDVALANILGVFVRVGLLLLWLSGVGFLLRSWLGAPELLDNPKLHAKIAIVILLTINGIGIEKIVLPLLQRQRGRPLLDGVETVHPAVVLGLGTISAVSWYAAFALGVMRELNFGPSAILILSIYLTLIGTGIIVVVAIWKVYRMLVSRQLTTVMSGDNAAISSTVSDAQHSG